MRRGEAIQVLVGPMVVVEGEVRGEDPPQLVSILGAVEINALLLHVAPEPFDEGVVRCAALTIHADPDAFLEQCTGELLAGELAALVRVEDLRSGALQERTEQS